VPKAVAYSARFYALEAYRLCPWLHRWGDPSAVPGHLMSEALAFVRAWRLREMREKVELAELSAGIGGGMGLGRK